MNNTFDEFAWEASLLLGERTVDLSIFDKLDIKMLPVEKLESGYRFRDV